MMTNDVRPHRSHIVIKQPYANDTIDSWLDDEMKKLVKNGFILVNTIENRALGIALEYKLLHKVTDSLKNQKLKDGEHYIVL